jgi:hypothetical protein
MTKNFEFYHGAALARLVHAKKPLSIRTFPNHGNASYVINEKVGLYLKYSSKRMPPWGFSFQKEHQEEIDELKDSFGYLILGLICADNGIVGLNYDELKVILDNAHEEIEWISVSRKIRGQYSVKGSDGSLLYKVAEGEYLRKVLDAI